MPRINASWFKIMSVQIIDWDSEDALHSAVLKTSWQLNVVA
jgi:hypothetical protein